MAVIHCCGGLRKCKTFVISPPDGIFESKLYYLEACPVCGHTVAVIRKIDFEYNVSMFRKINRKARNLFERLKPWIMFEEKFVHPFRLPASKYYLNYNERGRVKKCYSNLRSLKMGMFESYAQTPITYPSRLTKTPL